MRIAPIIALLLFLFSCSNQNREAINQPDLVANTTENKAEHITTDEAIPSKDECIFDQAAQTDDFVKEVDEFSNYTWDDLSKTATIFLENGDTLYAQRGGCYHFTYSGRLVTRDNHDVMDTSFWLNKGKWIAARVFRDYDRKLVDSLVSNHIYTTYNQNGNLQVVFEGDHGYSEFIQYTKRKGAWTETEIMFYMD